VVQADIFTDSLAVFAKERGEPALRGEPQNQAGSFSPPSAAKFVRTIFNIAHISVKIEFFETTERSGAVILYSILDPH